MSEVKLLPLPEAKPDDPLRADAAFNEGWNACRDSMLAHATAARDAEVEALRAEVERLRQLVNGGRGELPTNAVAWLDMEGDAVSLVFDKKSDSNRARKARAMELFQKVARGYYPLYLEPQPDRAERLEGALRDLLNIGDKFTGDKDEDAAIYCDVTDKARAALEQESNDA